MSDHGSSPRALADPVVDITDMFAFPSPQRSGTLVLVLNVFPFAGMSALFSDAVDYRVRLRPVAITSSGPGSVFAVNEKEYIFSCRFAVPVKRDGGSVQEGSCTTATGQVASFRVNDDRMKRSLYQRGLGYNYDAVKIFMRAGSKQPVVIHYQEHVPADVGAAFIWLKNRDPEHWRDVQNVEHVMGKYLISDKPMTIEQWAAERATVINEVVVDETPQLSSPDLPKSPGSTGKPTKT
jgi:hypothetical protein